MSFHRSKITGRGGDSQKPRNLLAKSRRHSVVRQARTRLRLYILQVPGSLSLMLTVPLGRTGQTNESWYNLGKVFPEGRAARDLCITPSCYATVEVSEKYMEVRNGWMASLLKPGR